MTATATPPTAPAAATSAPTSTPPAPAPAAAAPTKDAWTWDAEPGDPLPEPPLFLVVIAESGLGKTHIGCTFPGPVVCLDTEFRANEVLRKFRNIERYWKKIETFNDVRQGVIRAVSKHKSPGTILFDSGSDLQLLAEAEVLDKIAHETDEKGRAKKAHKTFHWGPVNKIFKNLFGHLRDKSWNAVFTARLKDEWAGDDRTGKRTAGGFVTDKLIYHADFAIQLEMRDGKRVGRVLKNGSRKPGSYRDVLEDEQLTYAGIREEMEAGAVQVLVEVMPPVMPMPAPAAVIPAPGPTPTVAQPSPNFAGVDQARVAAAATQAAGTTPPVDWNRAREVAKEGAALTAEIKAKVVEANEAQARTVAAAVALEAPREAVTKILDTPNPTNKIGIPIPHHNKCGCGSCPVPWPNPNPSKEEYEAHVAKVMNERKTAAAAAEQKPTGEAPAGPPVTPSPAGEAHAPPPPAPVAPAPAVAESAPKSSPITMGAGDTLVAMTEQADATFLATPIEITELEEFAIARGSTRDAFWRKLISSKYTTERGVLLAKHVPKLRNALKAMPSRVVAA